MLGRTLRLVAVSGVLAVAGGCAAGTTPSATPPASTAAPGSAPAAVPSSAGAAPSAPAGVSPPPADTLRRYGVSLPTCRASDLTMVVTDALYLRFDAEPACVEQYLRDLGLADLAGPPAVRPSAGPGWSSTTECRVYRWCLDPARSYDYYTVSTTPKVETELFVDKQRSPQSVYLRAAAAR